MNQTQALISFKAEIDSKSRILGVDYGIKKIGLSLSDRERIIASPYKTIIRSSLKTDIAAIVTIIKENDIGAIVFGYPVEASGNIGESCKSVEKFCHELTTKTSLPYVFQDERHSTSAVRQILSHTNFTRQKKDQLDDKMAASYVLQIVLDMMRQMQ